MVRVRFDVHGIALHGNSLDMGKQEVIMGCETPRLRCLRLPERLTSAELLYPTRGAEIRCDDVRWL